MLHQDVARTHVVGCTLRACALGAARRMLRKACRSCRSQSFAQGQSLSPCCVLRVASCMLRVACGTLSPRRRTMCGCAVHDAHTAVCVSRMFYFVAFPPAPWAALFIEIVDIPASGALFWSSFAGGFELCIPGARGRRIRRRSLFVAAAAAWCVSHCGRCSGHVAGGMLRRVERMQRVAFLLHACTGVLQGMRRAVARCKFASVASTVLHSERCTLHRARGMPSSSPSDGAPRSYVGLPRWCTLHVRPQHDLQRQRDIRVCGDLRYLSLGTRGLGRPVGPEADWGVGVQDGGVVHMGGGSVGFKGGSIARSKAVRDPRCWQLRKCKLQVT
jgi:hypothetical protein